MQELAAHDKHVHVSSPRYVPVYVRISISVRPCVQAQDNCAFINKERILSLRQSQNRRCLVHLIQVANALTTLLVCIHSFSKLKDLNSKNIKNDQISEPQLAPEWW